MSVTDISKTAIYPSLKGKRVLVTGGGSGIGEGVVEAFARQGARVAFVDIAEQASRDLVERLCDAPHKPIYRQCDLKDIDAFKATLAEIEEKLGGIDVLINNAANFYADYFEELTPEQIERQLATSLLGPMNVTRAVLPVMRKQRSGHIVTISSSAGLVGFEFCSAYAASKFRLEGWMESLQPEVTPFGIITTVVNPGFFRTELLTQESTAYAPPSIADYAERTASQQEWWKSQNGQQGGDPAKLAQALLTIVSEEHPPRRFIAGADAIATAEQKVADLQADIDAYRDLSTALAYGDA